MGRRAAVTERDQNEPERWDPDEPELDQLDDEPPSAFHRERREHGGAAQRLSDDQLAELTEEERVEAGLDDYDPDEVPPATE
jgi:hypothetical protein